MESIMKKHIVRIILSVVALSSIAAVAVKNQKKSATSPVTATKKGCDKKDSTKKCHNKNVVNTKKCDDKKDSTKKCRSNHRKQHGKTFKKEESKNNDTQTKKIGS